LLMNMVFQNHLAIMNFCKITALTYPEVGDFLPFMLLELLLFHWFTKNVTKSVNLVMYSKRLKVPYITVNPETKEIVVIQILN
jgi:hypothetical protein